MIDHPNLSMTALDLVDPTAAVSEALLLSSSVEEIEVVDPATGDYVGELAESTRADAEATLRRARSQADEGRWTQMSPDERGDLLTRLAGVLEDKADALAEIGTLESGTPARFARYLHAEAPIEILRNTTCTATNNGLDATAIGWHQPMYFAVTTVANSLAGGRATIVLPSTIAPLATIALLNCLLEADLPKGIVTAVLGTDEVFEVFSPSDVDSWVDSRPGSTSAGSLPLIADDGHDSGELWRAALLSHSTRAGCLPGVTHVLAPQGEIGNFIAGGVETINSLVIGDPWDDATEVGPTVAGMASITEYLEQMTAAGSDIERGADPDDTDRYATPALVSGLTNPKAALDRSICGPLAALIGYPDRQTADQWVASLYPSA